MLYKKKPIIIEAFRFGYDEYPIWFNEEEYSREIDKYGKTCKFYIKTLEGTMKANKGDYIIKGVNGELYPCKPDIFDKTYEEVSNEIQND